MQPTRTEPYRTVPNRTVPCSGNAPFDYLHWHLHFITLHFTIIYIPWLLWFTLVVGWYFLFSFVFQPMTVKLSLICSIMLCSPPPPPPPPTVKSHWSSKDQMFLSGSGSGSRLGLGIQHQIQFQNRIRKVRNWILDSYALFFSSSVRTRPARTLLVI